MANRKPIDILNELEEKLGILCIDDNHFDYQIAANTAASLNSNHEKQQVFDELVLTRRGYSSRIAKQVQKYCFFCNNPTMSAYQKVKSKIIHELSSYELPIIFEPIEANYKSGLVITCKASDWKDINPRLMNSMMEEIETKLSNAAVGTILFVDFDQAIPLLRSFAYSLMESPNIAVYLFQSFPNSQAASIELFERNLNQLRVHGVNCLAVESLVDLELLRGTANGH